MRKNASQRAQTPPRSAGRKITRSRTSCDKLENLEFDKCFDMEKKYNLPEQSPEILNEDIAINYPSSSIVDAIWTLIVNQSEEVQTLIAARLNKLRKQTDAKPYSIAELNSRIDTAEQQMANGDVVSGEEVHERMRSIINSI